MSVVSDSHLAQELAEKVGFEGSSTGSITMRMTERQGFNGRGHLAQPSPRLKTPHCVSRGKVHLAMA